MRTQNIFHPTRFYLLVRNGIVLNKSAILIVSAAVGGILLFLSALDAFLGYRPRFHQGLYLGVLYVGGLIVTNRIFKEFHDTVKGPAWLLIPASLLEKASSRIALSTVMYVITTMLIYFGFSLVSEGFNWFVIQAPSPSIQSIRSIGPSRCRPLFCLASPTSGWSYLFPKAFFE